MLWPPTDLSIYGGCKGFYNIAALRFGIEVCLASHLDAFI